MLHCPPTLLPACRSASETASYGGWKRLRLSYLYPARVDQVHRSCAPRTFPVAHRAPRTTWAATGTPPRGSASTTGPVEGLVGQSVRQLTASVVSVSEHRSTFGFTALPTRLRPVQPGGCERPRRPATASQACTGSPFPPDAPASASASASGARFMAGVAGKHAIGLRREQLMRRQGWHRL